MPQFSCFISPIYPHSGAIILSMIASAPCVAYSSSYKCKECSEDKSFQISWLPVRCNLAQLLTLPKISVHFTGLPDSLPACREPSVWQWYWATYPTHLATCINDNFNTERYAVTHDLCGHTCIAHKSLVYRATPFLGRVELNRLTRVLIILLLAIATTKMLPIELEIKFYVNCNQEAHFTCLLLNPIQLVNILIFQKYVNSTWSV